MLNGDFARAPFNRAFGRWIGQFIIMLVVSAGLMGASGFSAEARKYSAIIVDAHTGKTLHSRSADDLRYPASLTKMMTLYVLFEELKAKRMTEETRLAVSETAAAKQPSKLNLKPGTSISARDAILALVTKSANDVAAVIAENIEGTEAKFARRMTATARRIGMEKTVFRNASGLPDSKQVTTAREMVMLAKALRDDFPKYFEVFSTRHFKFRGNVYRNHNRLLGKYLGTDGIKTGYTRASGFNLVATVKREDKYVIGVIIGEKSGARRNRKMVRLLDRFMERAVARKDTPERRQIAAAGQAKVASASAPSVLTNPVERSTRDGDTVAASPVPRPVRPPESIRKSPAGKPIVIAARASRPNVAPAKPQGDARAVVSVQPRPITASAAKSIPESLPDGWSIQIGAFSTQDAAEQRLAAAESIGIGAIRGKPALAIKASDRQIFRARIAGFENKKLATNACRVLKRHSFNCYALAPN